MNYMAIKRPFGGQGNKCVGGRHALASAATARLSVASALAQACHELLQGPGRSYFLQRDEDATGVSGTGIVADVVETDGGLAVIQWRTLPSGQGIGSTAIYPSLAAIVAIHGHEGRTRLVPA